MLAGSRNSLSPLLPSPRYRIQIDPFKNRYDSLPGLKPRWLVRERNWMQEVSDETLYQITQTVLRQGVEAACRDRNIKPATVMRYLKEARIRGRARGDLDWVKLAEAALRQAGITFTQHGQRRRRRPRRALAIGQGSDCNPDHTGGGQARAPSGKLAGKEETSCDCEAGENEASSSRSIRVEGPFPPPESIRIIPNGSDDQAVEHVDFESPSKEEGRELDMAEFVELVLRGREFYRKMDPAERELEIEIPTEKNVLIGFMGDIHADNINCDLELLIRHIDLVQRTPLVYLGFLGDSLDNFHARYIDGIHERDVTTEGGRALVTYLFHKVKDRWLFFGHGDHERHEFEKAGWNFIRELKKQFPNAAYIGNLAVIHLKVGRQLYHLVVAHRMPGYSWWNKLHPQIRWLREHQLEDVDVIVGAHQHRKAKQESSEDGSKVVFLQTAPYLRTSAYARERGYDPKPRESLGMECVLLSGSTHRVLSFYNFEDGLYVQQALNAYEAVRPPVEDEDVYTILQRWRKLDREGSAAKAERARP